MFLKRWWWWLILLLYSGLHFLCPGGCPVSGAPHFSADCIRFCWPWTLLKGLWTVSRCFKYSFKRFKQFHGLNCQWIANVIVSRCPKFRVLAPFCVGLQPLFLGRRSGRSWDWREPWPRWKVTPRMTSSIDFLPNPGWPSTALNLRHASHCQPIMGLENVFPLWCYLEMAVGVPSQTLEGTSRGPCRPHLAFWKTTVVPTNCRTWEHGNFSWEHYLEISDLHGFCIRNKLICEG